MKSCILFQSVRHGVQGRRKNKLATPDLAWLTHAVPLAFLVCPTVMGGTSEFLETLCVVPGIGGAVCQVS